MKRRGMFFGCACLLAGSGFARAQSHPEFGYGGANGPAQWGSLDHRWAACSAGRNQSPVDLSRTVSADLAPIGISYPSFGAELVNTGHSLQVNHQPGSTLTVDGHAFRLVQFHFHAPSEHRIDGRAFPMEAHFVHQDEAGNLAVLGVLFEEGAPNETLGRLWAAIPTGHGQPAALPGGISALGLLPANRQYFRYSGSLTTPPCSEGVLWVLLRQPMSVSREQLSRFERALGFANNRPAQPANARAVLQAR